MPDRDGSAFTVLALWWGYTPGMRGFSLLFLVIAVIVFVQFLIYVIRGPVDPIVAAGIFISFLACAVPALYLLRPLEGREDLQKRRERFRKRREAKRENSNPDD